MANAFSPGRVSVWHTDLTSFLPAYDGYKKLGCTDIFLNAAQATVQAMRDIRETAPGKPRLSADGKPFRAHVYVDGTHGETGGQLGINTFEAVTKLKPGVAEIDFESGDDSKIGLAVDGLLKLFRGYGTWAINFPLCINVVPLKGYVLPIVLMAADPNCYVRVQRYYGAEMRPAEPTLCREDIVGRGFPAERFSFMESAKPRRLVDGSLFIDLPVFSDKGEIVRTLSGGAIYNSNLLREAGLV